MWLAGAEGWDATSRPQKVAAQLDPHSLLFQCFRLTTTAPEGPATPPDLQDLPTDRPVYILQCRWIYNVYVG